MRGKFWLKYCTHYRKDSSKSIFYALPEKSKTVRGLADFLTAEESRKNMKPTSNGALIASAKTVEKQGMKNKRKPRMSKEEAKKKFPCRICNQMGHWANECHKNTVSSNNDPNNKPKSFVAYTYSTVLDSNDYTNVWIADSGSSFHMSCRREWFESYEDIDGKSTPIKGCGGIVYANGIGNIRITSLVNDKEYEVLLWYLAGRSKLSQVRGMLDRLSLQPSK